MFLLSSRIKLWARIKAVKYESGGGSDWEPKGAPGFEAVVPNPKLKLMDQVREVMRLKHYAIRTEKCYCDWIRRFAHKTGVSPENARLRQQSPLLRD